MYKRQVLGEDGNVSGLEEQLKAIRKDKAFLFKEEKPGTVITVSYTHLPAG